MTETAFRSLYEGHRKRVYGLCFRLTGNDSDALDASQEAFTRVFRHLHRFEGRSRLSSWIDGIAANASRELRRTAARRRCTSLESLGEHDRDLHADRDLPVPEVVCARAELEQSVHAAIARLPSLLRHVVARRYLDGCSYREIARELRLPVGTVKSRLFRAHAALLRLLAARAGRG